MGLDMYLSKRHYVKRWDHIPEAKQYAVVVTRGGKPATHINPERVSYVIEQVGYWRKANQIHQWFVDNVQDGVDDCRDAYVGREHLVELLRLVTEALNNRDKAPELLPSRNGFFFGSTAYDDYYWSDLEETKIMLTALLAETDEGDFYYHSSW